MHRPHALPAAPTRSFDRMRARPEPEERFVQKCRAVLPAQLRAGQQHWSASQHQNGRAGTAAWGVVSNSSTTPLFFAELFAVVDTAINRPVLCRMLQRPSDLSAVAADL